MNAWAAKPHLVSLGSQKNFERFMADLAVSAPPPLDAPAYKRLIAQVILFKGIQKAVKAGGYQSFQANITAYTVAILSRLLADRLSLDAIWQRQSLSPQLQQYAGEVARVVDEALRDSAGARMVSEWAKKEDCWIDVRGRTFPVPTVPIPELA